MHWTPIGVRGKKTRDRDGNLQTTRRWRPPDPKRFKRERQRMMGDETPLRKGKRTAPLEQLPPEVLQQIFLMSENLSFPRSSLRIGRLLSARTFLLELIVAAFRPAWDVWFGCPKKDIQSYYGWKRDPDMSFFQSALLACPWIDLQLILDAKQVWYRKFGRGRHFWHALDWGDGCSDHLPSLVSRDAHEPGGPDHGHDVKACFEADWQLFLEYGRIDNQFRRYLEYRKDDRTGYNEIHGATRTPSRLIDGPFTWEIARWLYWFLHSGGRLSTGENWELTLQGYKSLLTLHSDDLASCMLRLFTMLGVFGHWPKHVLEDQLREMDDKDQATAIMDRLPATWDLSGNILAEELGSRDRLSRQTGLLRSPMPFNL